MRILQLNNFEAIGGGSDRVFQLNTRMLLDRGHAVATLSCGDQSFDSRKRTELLPRNGYIQRNPIATLKNIRDFVYRPDAAAAVYRLVREFKPDVAHLHIFYGQLSSSVLDALDQLGIPSVMTVHEYRMLCPVSTLYTPRLGICERCAAGNPWHAVVNRCNRGSAFASSLSAVEAMMRDRKYAYPAHVEHFFMVSQFCLDKHAQYLPALKEKSSVLYNFVADEDIAKTLTDVAEDAPFIYCGRLSREKGVDLLCEAFTQRPKLRLRIAGEGPIAMELRRRFARSSNISFLGKLAGPALKEEVRQARFSVAPSEWYENNPMAILESFAQGTPVLGAAIGGIPELVIDTQTGIQFAPSSLDALLFALDKATSLTCDQRQVMGQHALNLIRSRHGETSYYQQLVKGYEHSMFARGVQRRST